MKFDAFDYEINCLRCGLCCYFMNINGFKTKCRYLVIHSDKTSSCKIYKDRLNTFVGLNNEGKKEYCILRKNSKRKYENCPFN